MQVSEILKVKGNALFTIAPEGKLTEAVSVMAQDARVRDIMERDPVTASPAMEVSDLRRTMIDSGARYLPVMDRDKLLGVISFRDVAKAVLEEQDFENRMLKGYIKNWPE
ncbi:MAG: CBS domain-containing protein [Betaproteobacteria bacterium]|nr:MAG: CBS domain-containing protein [Betaproteobacteria bacterium]